MRKNKEYMTYRLLPSSWILPGMPLFFSSLYMVLSVVEEPFRPDLVIASLISMLIAILLTLLVATSRIIIKKGNLDIRHYGIRKSVCLEGLMSASTRPAAFSTIIILKDRYGCTALIHLGYWKSEKALLDTLSEYILAVNADCSVNCAKILHVETKGSITDMPRPGLLEPFLILAWILSSTALSPIIGLLLTP